MSSTKVVNVEMLPRNTFMQESSTNAELGTSNTWEKGYMAGIIAQPYRNSSATRQGRFLLDTYVSADRFKTIKYTFCNERFFSSYHGNSKAYNVIFEDI